MKQLLSLPMCYLVIYQIRYLLPESVYRIVRFQCLENILSLCFVLALRGGGHVSPFQEA